MDERNISDGNYISYGGYIVVCRFLWMGNGLSGCRGCGVKKLTQKQRKFCEEYLVDLNATQAAIRAGYSKKTAFVIGHENLSKPNIEKYIKEKQEETRDRTLVTVDFVINGIKAIAEDGEQENNRLKAYDLLGKHLGVYELDNKIDITTTIIDPFSDD